MKQSRDLDGLLVAPATVGAAALYLNWKLIRVHRSTLNTWRASIPANAWSSGECWPKITSAPATRAPVAQATECL